MFTLKQLSHAMVMLALLFASTIVFAAPTIESQTSISPSPTLAGTCDSGAGSVVTLSIRAAARKKEKVASVTGVSVTCSEAGTWSYKLEAELVNGNYDVTVCNPDETNCDATSAELTIAAIDPPTIETQTSTSASPTLTGTCGAGAGSAVTLSVRSAARKKEKVTEVTDVSVTCSEAGSWSYSLIAELVDGTYDVSVCNPETNCDTSSGELTIDATAPTITAANIGPTKNLRAVISGTTNAADGQLVTLKKGKAILGTAEVSKGAFSITPRSDFAVGVNEVTLEVSDVAGNLATKSLTVSIDTTAPTITASNVGPTKNLRAVISGTTDAADGQIVTLKSGKTILGSAEVSKGAFSITPRSNFAVGVNELTLEVADLAGNLATKSLSVTIDTIVPTIEAADVGPTQDVRAVVTGTTDVEDGQTITLRSGKAVVGTAVVRDGAFSITPTVDFERGVNALTLEVSDVAGNLATKSLSVTIDTTAPTITAADVGPTKDVRAAITGTTNAEDGQTITLRRGKEVIGTAVVRDGAYSITPTVDFERGVNALTLEVSDVAGNLATKSLNVTIDATAPTIQAADVGPTKDVRAVITGTTDAEDGQTITLRRGKEVIGTAVVRDGAFSITPTVDFERGVNDLTLEVSDVAGNVGSKAIAVTIIADSDNDGIPDDVEIGPDTRNPRDSDKDGTPDYLDTDSDNDGIADAIEAGKDTANPKDTDEDGVPDYRDLDSDNDGLTDVEESGGKDTNRDGILDEGEALTKSARDTDEDGIPDYQDLDSNNDGVNDIDGTDAANLDADKDGRIDDDTDTDVDGIADVFDGRLGEPGTDTDADKDGIPDSVEKGAGEVAADTDGDGTPDYLDTDSDNDGIADSLERGDGKAPADTDFDGTPDYKDLDSDNDGINDVTESGGKDADNDGLLDAGAERIAALKDTDNDGIPDYKDSDSDDDGVLDIAGTKYAALDEDMDGKIDDDRDSDKDGIADRIDTRVGHGKVADSDLDSIPDSVEKGSDALARDSDADGEPDYLDIDSDNDGIPDEVEAGADPANPVDTDEDVAPDYRDLDSDNDGITDIKESGGTDFNGDGKLDAGAALRTKPNDTDDDGIPDHIDPDSDNDGINDIDGTENAALDADKDGRIDDLTDLDGDGIPDVVDGAPGSPGTSIADNDNDGVIDTIDLDDDNDGIPDAQEGDGSIDSDGDMIPDSFDIDSDNDSLTDAFEADPVNNFDADGDGEIDNFADTNGDGLNDGTLPSMTPADTDADGEPNYLDLNSDGDLYTDAIENGDYDNNGIHDSIENGCDGCVSIAGGAGGGGSFGWMFLIGLAMLLSVRTTRVRQSIVNVAAVLSLSLLGSNAMATDCGGTAEDFESCLYGTIGAVYSQLDPQGVSSGWATDGDNDAGFSLGIGWQFAQDWYAQLNYADLGEAELTNFNPNIPGTESIAYTTTSAIIGYMFGDADSNWRPYVQGGAVMYDVDQSIPKICDEDDDVQLTGGLGIEYQPDNSSFFARAGADWFAEDAAVFGLTIGSYFGSSSAGGNISQPDSAPVAPAISSGAPAASSVTVPPAVAAPAAVALGSSVVNAIQPAATALNSASEPIAAACVCGDPSVAIFYLPTDTVAKNITKLGSLPEFGNSHALSPSEFYEKLSNKYNSDPAERKYLDYVWKSMGYSNGFADANAGQFSNTVLERGTKGLLGFGEYHGYAYSQLNTSEYDRQAFHIQSLNGHDVHYMKTCGNYMYFCGDCD